MCVRGEGGGDMSFSQKKKVVSRKDPEVTEMVELANKEFLIPMDIKDEQNEETGESHQLCRTYVEIPM